MIVSSFPIQQVALKFPLSAFCQLRRRENRAPQLLDLRLALGIPQGHLDNQPTAAFAAPTDILRRLGEEARFTFLFVVEPILVEIVPAQRIASSCCNVRSFCSQAGTESGELWS